MGQEEYKRDDPGNYSLADWFGFAVPGYYKIKIILSLKKKINMLTLILYLAGIIGFALFYKFIDWFEKI